MRREIVCSHRRKHNVRFPAVESANAFLRDSRDRDVLGHVLRRAIVKPPQRGRADTKANPHQPLAVLIPQFPQVAGGREADADVSEGR